MAQDDSVGIVKTHFFTFAEPPNEMVLESGEALGPIKIAYETYGTLNEDKSNAILIAHALSGDAHVAGRHRPEDRKSGWWDEMVGPGKAFDTGQYFVICSNVLGGCRGSTGPSAINPITRACYGLTFPLVTIGDMVRAQKALVDHLGIERLLSVAGGSMGGMQALDWAVRFPAALQSVMIIASTHLSGAQQIAFDAVGRHAIRADSEFNGGDYYGTQVPTTGLSIARMLAHITYLSDESMRAKFGRSLRNAETLQYDFQSEYAVETYLDYQGQQFVERFDPNSYLYITKAMDYFDISASSGSLDAALSSVESRALVVSFSTDWLYPPYHSEQIVYTLARQGKDVTYCQVESDAGHDAFLLEVEVLGKLVSGFLERASKTERPLSDTAPAKTRGVSPLPSPGTPAPRPESPPAAHRGDVDLIVSLVESGSKVLDVGCGDGELLDRLTREKNVTGTGLEIDQDRVVSAAQKGLSVIHADVDEGLKAFRTQSFDCATLSMTFQVIEQPRLVLQELLRVARKCILSFPNFGHWGVRSKIFFTGMSPVTKGLPYDWYNTPNRHFFSIKDFRVFCRELGIRIEREIPLDSDRTVRYWPNCRARDAVYVVTASD